MALRSIERAWCRGRVARRLRVAGLHSSSPRSLVASRSLSRSATSTATSGSQSFTHQLPLSSAQRPTIYALATPPGKGGVAVLRVSGPDVGEVWRRMVRLMPTRMGSQKGKASAFMEEVLEHRRMERCYFVHAETPHSYTTEPTLELHTHSGPALLSSLLHSLSLIPLLRPAERGEFTRRAVLNGRMNLVQAEGVRDLLDAQTEEQRRSAGRAVRGEVGRRFEEIRSEMVGCLAMVEALIDFGEGEDIEDGVYDAARARVQKLHATIASHLSDKRGEILRSGIELAIFGPPNAGKSSLLNFLARRDVAIVTAIPGTTRDVLEMTLDIGGLPVVVADTAGLREGGNVVDVVEQIGVQRARDRVQDADASLCVLSIPEVAKEGIPEAVAELMTGSTMVVLNKRDVSSADEIATAVTAVSGYEVAVWVISVQTGERADRFMEGLERELRSRYEGSGDALITNGRQRGHLEDALCFLDGFLARGREDVVLGAEELRYGCVPPDPPPPPPPQPTDTDSDDNATDTDTDGDDDVFYTPNTSPRVSLNGEAIMTIDFSPPQSSSSSSASTVGSDDGHHSFAWSSSSQPTTRATTPLTDYSGKLDDDTPTSRTRSPSPHEPWARDVRWLVQPSSASSTSSKRSQPSSAKSEPLAPVTRPPQVPRRAKTTSARRKQPRPRSRERMSALWEEDESADPHTPSAPALVASGSATSRSRTISAPYPLAPRQQRTPSIRSGSSRQSSASSYTTSSRTVEIPSPLPVSDGGAPAGYTSLVLPRAAPPQQPSSRRNSMRFSISSSSLVDLTRSGMAQTTMSTISLTKNAGAIALAHPARRRTISLISSTSRAKPSPTPPHLLKTLPSPLSFTSHTPPPTKVSASQVLVQVWAVGLDALDDMLVREKAARGDSFGFVPGRSFVGRAVECGFEVTSVAKSDWVMGLLDVRKCGALSEFIVVDRRRLTRSPPPSRSLTIEQLALLPLCGIPAHRAVRTAAHLHRGARALVLHAHDGAGAFALMELAWYGVKVTAQIPRNPGSDGDDRSAIGEVSMRVTRWGAREVILDDAISATAALPESSFDLVIDPLGGRAIWDASQRILHPTGQFTTLVGDRASDSEHALPSLPAHVRSNFRSLRHAFAFTGIGKKSPSPPPPSSSDTSATSGSNVSVNANGGTAKRSKKDRKKSLSYAWVSALAVVDDAGDDVRDSLEAVAEMAREGVLVPHVPRSAVFPFERAPRAFAGAGGVSDSAGGEGGEGGRLARGRTAVVRIIES
ncbi:hypothetical protein BD410DRAFT_833876 [Rickenella mellea]|uniref:Enoyl reductase (ER) domain-containing protein n=1 Tax=Rickenella mellea TaxID=50990 RepID=A0A4R5XGR3_9AGAM|nr:hypothetical protein BD410DRAFT_833876 [Rickenella mellea]